MTSIDWMDVSGLILGLEGIHELRVELIVTTATQAASGRLAITARAWVPSVEAQQTKTIAEVGGFWPAREQPTFDGRVFALLYELDRAIGAAYDQNKLPG